MRNVPSLETVYRDYSSKGVKFYYVYKQLAHPETNSYVDPVNIKERLAHIAAAKSSLKTDFDWICDNMENELKHSMGGRPNSEFVIGPDGKVLIRRTWSDPQQLRSDLEKLVGKSETTTTVADLEYKIDPQPKQVAKGVVKRLQLESAMTALKSEVVSMALNGDDPTDKFFVKLRAEADDALLESGKGQLYLGFHVDPIYQVHWNNDAMQVQYELNLPEGVTANQPTGEGPKVDVSADADPREFLIDIDSTSSIDQPIEVTIRYMACDDAETFCVPATEVFRILLERDSELGSRRGGSRAGRGGRRGGNQRGNMAERMMRRDSNKDGKISKDEMPERAQRRFEQMDSNKDGFIDKEELKTMSESGRGKRGRKKKERQ